MMQLFFFFLNSSIIYSSSLFLLMSTLIVSLTVIAALDKALAPEEFLCSDFRTFSLCFFETATQKRRVKINSVFLFPT